MSKKKKGFLSFFSENFKSEEISLPTKTSSKPEKKNFLDTFSYEEASLLAEIIPIKKQYARPVSTAVHKTAPLGEDSFLALFPEKKTFDRPKSVVETNTGQIQLSLSPSERKRLEGLSQKRGMSLEAFIREAIAYYLGNS